MDKKLPVFVYGTLRRNEENHYVLLGARCIAQQSWIKGVLYDTGEGFPALKSSKKGKVYGELYVVDDSLLQQLDLLENYHGPGKKNVYHRIVQEVFTDTGVHEAFVYTIDLNHKSMLKKIIDSGDWRIYHSFNHKPSFLYFAYGSCMDHERFILDGVDHYFQDEKGVGILDGYKLRYTRRVSDGGRADLVEEGDVVEGIVYEVHGDVLPYLYRREGVKYKSYRPALITVSINGRPEDNVLTFLVVNKDEETAPPIGYATEIIRGATGILSDTYVEKLKKQLNELKIIL